MQAEAKALSKSVQEGKKRVEKLEKEAKSLATKVRVMKDVCVEWKKGVRV